MKNPGKNILLQMIERYKDEVDSSLIRGLSAAYLDKKKFLEAVKAFKACLNLKPSSKVLLQRLIDLYKKDSDLSLYKELLVTHLDKEYFAEVIKAFQSYLKLCRPQKRYQRTPLFLDAYWVGETCDSKQHQDRHNNIEQLIGTYFSTSESVNKSNNSYFNNIVSGTWYLCQNTMNFVLTNPKKIMTLFTLALTGTAAAQTAMKLTAENTADNNLPQKETSGIAYASPFWQSTGPISSETYDIMHDAFGDEDDSTLLTRFYDDATKLLDQYPKGDVAEFKDKYRYSHSKVEVRSLLSDIEGMYRLQQITQLTIITEGDVWISADGSAGLTPPRSITQDGTLDTRALVLNPEAFSPLKEKETQLLLQSRFKKQQQNIYSLLLFETLEEWLKHYYDMENLRIIFQRHKELSCFSQFKSFHRLQRHCSSMKTKPGSILFDAIEELKLVNPMYQLHVRYYSLAELIEMYKDIEQEIKNIFIDILGDEPDTHEYWHYFQSIQYDISDPLLRLKLLRLYRERNKQALMKVQSCGLQNSNQYFAPIKKLLGQQYQRGQNATATVAVAELLLDKLKDYELTSPILRVLVVEENYRLAVTSNSATTKLRGDLELRDRVGCHVHSSYTSYASMSEKRGDDAWPSEYDYYPSDMTRIGVLAEELTHAVDSILKFSHRPEFILAMNIDQENIQFYRSMHLSLLEKIKSRSNKDMPLIYALDALNSMLWRNLTKLLRPIIKRNYHLSNVTISEDLYIDYLESLLSDALSHCIHAYPNYRDEFFAKIQSFYAKWGENITQLMFPNSLQYFRTVVIPACNNHYDKAIQTQMVALRQKIEMMKTAASEYTSPAKAVRI